MPRKKNDDILVVPKNATLKQIYAIAKKQFTAADLQEYTEIDWSNTVPAQQVLAELEAINEEEKRKLQRKKRKS